MSTYGRRDDFAKSPIGLALAGAQLYVCTQPATTTSVPPSPLATIYSDMGVTEITQPIVADGFGHTFFYALPSSLYTLVWVYSGVITEVLVDQTVFSAGGGSGAVESGDQYAIPYYTLSPSGNTIAGSQIFVDPTGQALFIAPQTVTNIGALFVIADPGTDDIADFETFNQLGIVQITTAASMLVQPITGAGFPALTVQGAGDEPSVAIYTASTAAALNVYNSSSTLSVQVDHSGNLFANEGIYLLGGVYDSTGSLGSSGQVLTTTGVVAKWENPSSGSPAFSSITSGTNTSATMVLGTGSELTFSGSGLVNANELYGVAIGSTAPTSGQVLTATSGTAAHWATPTAGAPGGSDTDVQFNLSGSFDGTSALTWDYHTSPKVLGVTGNITMEGVAYSLTTQTSNYQTEVSDYMVLANGTITVTLTDAVVTGQVQVVKNIGTGVVTIVSSGSENIDGAASYALSPLEAISVVWDGSNWWIF
jgi:hypothetical protein